MKHEKTNAIFYFDDIKELLLFSDFYIIESNDYYTVFGKPKNNDQQLNMIADFPHKYQSEIFMELCLSYIS